MNQLVPIERHDGVATVSSLEVAKDFRKDHCHIIRDIEAIIASFQSIQNRIDSQSPQNWGDSHSADCKDYFIPGVYRDRKNRQQPMYYLTRDGFQLLAMGFTGEYALQWKLRYIEAFDQMETAIRKAMQPIPAAQPSAPLAIAEQLLLAAKNQEQRITAIESKQAALEQVVSKTDWLTGAKHRVEAITGKPVKNSGLFLAHIYDEIETSKNVCLESRRVRLYKKLKGHGEVYRSRDISKLYIISRDEKLRTAFDMILDKREQAAS